MYRRVNFASRNALQVCKEAKNRDQNRVHVYGDVLNHSIVAVDSVVGNVLNFSIFR